MGEIDLCTQLVSASSRSSELLRVRATAERGWRSGSDSPKACQQLGSFLFRSASLANFWIKRVLHLSVSRKSLEREEATEEAPRLARGDRQGCTERNTTGADRRWPQRNTVIHSARLSGSPAPFRVARSPVVFLVATLR